MAKTYINGDAVIRYANRDSVSRYSNLVTPLQRFIAYELPKEMYWFDKMMWLAQSQLWVNVETLLAGKYPNGSLLNKQTAAETVELVTTAEEYLIERYPFLNSIL